VPTAVTETRAAPPPPPARPRSAEADHAILDAAAVLLSEHSYAELTMAGVAERAGVSTATLYRRYPSKEFLVVDAVAACKPPPEIGDYGSLEADLRARFETVVDAIASSDDSRLMEGLIGEIVRNRPLADAMNERFIAPRIADLVAMIERAVSRGEIDPLPNPSLAAEMLIGVIHFRTIVTGEPIDLPLIDDLVPLTMRMLGAEPPRTAARSKRRARKPPP